MACVETSPAGFVKLPRAHLRTEWSRNPICLALFSHLLARANREPKTWCGIEIGRGQLVTSREHLVQITGIPLQQLRTALKRLEREGLTRIVTSDPTRASKAGATHELTRGYTLVTICNYDNYEGYNPSANPLTNPQKTGELTRSLTSPLTTTKEEIRKKISAIAPDLLDSLSEWAQYRQEIGTPLDLPSIISAEAGKLRELSGGDPELARRIVREAVSNRWKGLNPIRATASAAPAPPSTPPAATKREHLKRDELMNY